MKYIVVSEANAASKNIGKFFEKRKFPADIKIIKTKNNVLDLESDLKSIKDAEIVIVASTHKSAAGVPMLNAHFTGNFGEDVSHGGAARTLSIAPALYQRAAVLEYERLKAEDSRLKTYTVGIEATHHGPTLDLPILFVEVGSSEKEWGDLVACEAAAKVIWKLVAMPSKMAFGGNKRNEVSLYNKTKGFVCQEDPHNPSEARMCIKSKRICLQTERGQSPLAVRVVVGFGGGHYCPQFTKKLFEGGFAFGHICPKYAADSLTEDVILQAINKTTPRPEKVLIEWKGLKKEPRDNIISLLEKSNIKWEKC